MTQTPHGLRVAGELDLISAPALTRALRACTQERRRVEVDLGEVTFVDLTGARTFFEAAADLQPDGVLVLRRTPAILRRIVELVQWHDPRVEVEGL